MKIATHELLVVAQLYKRFRQKEVLSDLNFTLYPGELTILLGRNGSGKSTCLSILSTQQQATRGLIEYPLKKPYSSAQCRRQIGCIFQKTALIGEISVRENIRIAGQLFGLSNSDCDRRLADYLEYYECSELINAPVHELSLGQRRIIDIIRTFLHEPTLFFFDEPTQGLDGRRRELFWEHLNTTVRESQAIALASTHFQNEIPPQSRVLALEHGQIVSDSYPDTSSEVNLWVI